MCPDFLGFSFFQKPSPEKTWRPFLINFNTRQDRSEESAKKDDRVIQIIWRIIANKIYEYLSSHPELYWTFIGSGTGFPDISSHLVNIFVERSCSQPIWRPATFNFFISSSSWWGVQTNSMNSNVNFSEWVATWIVLNISLHLQGDLG